MVDKATIEFEVTVTHHHARLALRRFFWGILGPSWVLWLAVLLCAVSIAHDLRDGQLKWPAIFSLSALSILGLVIVAAYVQRRRRVSSLLDQLDGTPVTYRLSDEELATSSTLGSSSVKWPVFQELRIDNDLALLFYARGAYTTLPIAQLSSLAISSLKEKVANSGGKVVDTRK